MPEKIRIVFKIHVNLNNEWKRPLQQQGTSSCKCKHLLLQAICSENKEKKGIK